MRRSFMVMVLASLCAFGLVEQRTARAEETCAHGGCTSHSCKPVHHAVNKLGFSYFMKGKGGCSKGKNPNCRTYIDPHRAPRDFWMLR
jgi:hypothetical protein